MARYWSGDFYGHNSGMLSDCKLLILGESNYSPEPIGTANEGIVIEVMSKVLAGEKFTFFNKLSRLLVNRGEMWLTQSQSVEFWHGVAFHNYVPVIAANTYGQRPPASLWKGEAPRLFLEVVKVLQPEAILVCGVDTWHHLPPSMPTTRTYRSREQSWPTKEYETGAGYPAVAVPILHPSGRGWTYERNAPIVDQLFDLVTAIRAESGRPKPALVPLGRGE